MNLEKYIMAIENFPEEGIVFRDITPLLQDGAAFQYTVTRFVDWTNSLDVNVDLVVGPESRGFIFGCPVAYEIGAGFVPVRKPGKLPRATIAYKYDLEYGSNEVHMHDDAIKPGQNVVIIDDLLATGGTIEATIKLVESLGGNVAGIAFVIELEALEGIKNLEGYNVLSLLKY